MKGQNTDLFLRCSMTETCKHHQEQKLFWKKPFLNISLFGGMEETAFSASVRKCLEMSFISQQEFDHISGCISQHKHMLQQLTGMESSHQNTLLTIFLLPHHTTCTLHLLCQGRSLYCTVCVFNSWKLCKALSSDNYNDIKFYYGRSSMKQHYL